MNVQRQPSPSAHPLPEAADDPGEVESTRMLLIDELDRMNRLVEELMTLARGKSMSIGVVTQAIDILDFVELAEIDPIFYDHPYYLAPGAGGRFDKALTAAIVGALGLLLGAFSVLAAL